MWHHYLILQQNYFFFLFKISSFLLLLFSYGRYRSPTIHNDISLFAVPFNLDISFNVCRCANSGRLLPLVVTTLLMLMAVTLWVPSKAEASPQFNNLRIFRRAGLFNRDVWRPLSFLGLQEQPAEGGTSRSSSSPIKRVSMATLLQQLQAVNAKENKPGDNEVDTELSSTTTSTTSTTTEVPSSNNNTDSPIRRVHLPAGSVTYSGAKDNPGQTVVININPHLRRLSSSTTSTTSTTTLPTTTPTTSTTPPSTTTTSSSKELRFQPTIISKIKSSALKTTNAELRLGIKNHKFSKRPNSPIYYIKLPASAFVPVASRAPPDSKKKPSLINIISVHRQETAPITTSTTTTSTTTSTESPVIEDLTTVTEVEMTSTTTLKPPRTNSRIINIKGPFVFNGKPGGIYSSAAPYKAPNYLDILNELYPKLKRAQFIRR